jgi:hypothetical protein
MVTSALTQFKNCVCAEYSMGLLHTFWVVNQHYHLIIGNLNMLERSGKSTS